MGFTVYAEDLDDGPNGEFHFTLIGDQTAFTIDQYTGWITTLSILDKEAIRKCTLTIVVTDSGSPSLTSTSYLHINIIDYNDNPPMFSQESYIAEGKNLFVKKISISQKN